MATIPQIQRYWANGYAAPVIEALRPKQAKLEEELLTGMNQVAEAIFEVGSVAHMGDFIFAMHGFSNRDAGGNPIEYKSHRDQYSRRMIGMVFAGARNNKIDGPDNYWMLDESYLDRKTTEVRDRSEKEWSAVRYQVRKDKGKYIGRVIVPAFTVERRHILGELGSLGEVTERDFVVRTLERGVSERNAEVPKDNPIILGKDLTSDFREIYPSSQYGAAIEQVAHAVALINSAQKQKLAAMSLRGRGGS